MFVYVVARDFGFAPNPFGGTCTLATCKPEIRRRANIGDWVIGTGSASYDRDGNIVFAMKVTEAMTFDDYWDDARYQYKKPHFNAGKKHGYGDNIYHRVAGKWRQLDSHHSHANGSPNANNIVNDTQVDRVLLSTDFVYWGGSGPKIPQHLKKYHGQPLLIVRGYRRHFAPGHEEALVDWIRSLGEVGYSGRPLEW